MTTQRWRPEVQAFADLMEARLRANDHKPGWKGDDPWSLMDRLFQEARKLGSELLPHPGVKLAVRRARIGAEAADVANFAMMIADVRGALPPSQSKEADRG